MKIVSFNEITKCLKRINTLFGSGKLSLYGRGEKSLHVTAADMFEGATLENITGIKFGITKDLKLEYKDLTIDAGIHLPVTNNSQVAYIKVNNILTVNGHLHMDNRGGSFVDGGQFVPEGSATMSNENNILVYNQNNSCHTFDKYSLSVISDNESCPQSLYADLSNYASQETFFTSQVGMTGAGPNGFTKYQYEDWSPYQNGQACVPPRDDSTYPEINQYASQWWNSLRNTWKPGGYAAYKNAVAANTFDPAAQTPPGPPRYYYSVRGARSQSMLSGGGNLWQLQQPTTDNHITLGGGGGGMIMLYSSTFTNFGPVWNEHGVGDFSKNVHTNGGSSVLNNVESTDTNKSSIRGGGCIIIAAKHIIIGAQGSITADGGDGNGIMGLLGRSKGTKYTFNSGVPQVYNNTFSGGAGFAQHIVR